MPPPDATAQPQCRPSRYSSTNFDPKYAQEQESETAQGPCTAARPRQPKRMRPISSTPKMIQAMQRQNGLVHEVLSQQIGDEDESGEQRQGQQSEPRRRSAGTSLSRGHRAAAATVGRSAIRRVRSRRSRNTSSTRRDRGGEQQGRRAHGEQDVCGQFPARARSPRHRHARAPVTRRRMPQLPAESRRGRGSASRWR